MALALARDLSTAALALVPSPAVLASKFCAIRDGGGMPRGRPDGVFWRLPISLSTSSSVIGGKKDGLRIYKDSFGEYIGE